MLWQFRRSTVVIKSGVVIGLDVVTGCRSMSSAEQSTMAEMFATDVESKKLGLPFIGLRQASSLQECGPAQKQRERGGRVPARSLL